MPPAAALSSDEPAALSPRRLTHLRQLEAESIHVIREVAAELDRPVMLYSIGKDSAVMVRLAQKAFAPAPLPFPLLHIDTTWKFQAMYEFRDRFCREQGLDLRIHTNRRAIAEGINPFDHGSNKYTHIMKTHALLEALGHARGLSSILRPDSPSQAVDGVIGDGHRLILG